MLNAVSIVRTMRTAQKKERNGFGGRTSRVLLPCLCFFLIYCTAFLLSAVPARSNAAASPAEALSESGEPINPLFQMDAPLIVPTQKSEITIRRGPGFTYPVLQVVPTCHALRVEEKGLWYRVRYENDIGYVYGASFDDENAYETDRLKGILVGIDPDGQIAPNALPEYLAPNSKVLTAKMNERNFGVNSKTPDYTINLSVAGILKKTLEEEGASVLLTRESSEIDLSNRERAELLSKAHCDVLVRLSCTSSDNPMTKGVEIQVSRFSQDEQTAAFAAEVLSNISKAAGLESIGVSPVSENTFLNWAEGIAVSVELGYLTNSGDEKILLSDVSQLQIAVAIKEAVVSSFYGMDQ